MSKTKFNIVVADDDQDDQLLLQEAFRATTFPNELAIANDGVELLEYLSDQHNAGRKNWPDLILLDLNMPRMDGREALSLIKLNPKFRSIPVVVLTTSSDEDDILKSYALGANSYICKPVSFSGLVDIVDHLNRYWLNLVQLPLCAAVPVT
jgi:two-component system response regulator